MQATEVVDAPAKAAENAIKEYSPTEAALAELRQRYAAVVWDCSTVKGDKDARAVRKELVTLRTSLEGKRKALKAPALEYSRRIDSEAARITAQIVELEEPVDAAIKAEEARKEAERQRRAAEESVRVEAIQKRIAEIRAIVGTAGAAGSDDIAMHLQLVRSVAIDDTFQEFQPMAEAAKAEVVAQLERLHAAAVEREVAQARIEAERAELARLRAAEEERQRLERERIAAEQRAEAERLAAERAALERQQAEVRAEEERRAAAARAEQERLDREASEARRRADEEAARHRAEADRIAREAREAEERRMAEQRAELQRQQEEAQRREREAADARRRELVAAEAAAERVREAGPALLASLKVLRAYVTFDDEGQLSHDQFELMVATADLAIAAATEPAFDDVPY